MSTPPRSARSASFAAALRVALGIVTGFFLVAASNAIALAASVPWPQAGGTVRLAHHLFDFTATLGLGVIAAIPVTLWVAFFPGPAWASLLAYTCLSTPVMFVLLGDDLQRQAVSVFNGRHERLLLVVYVLLCAMAVPVAHAAGSLLSRFRRLRWLPVGVALGGLVTNHLILRDDYPGVHGAVAWTAAILGGAALAPFAAELAQSPLAGRFRRFAILFPILAVACLFLPIPNRVRIELFREPGAIVPWVLASTVWSAPDAAGSDPPPADPWYSDRSLLPPVPPTVPPLIPKNPVVVMITIDATRADAVFDFGVQYPLFVSLQQTGATFLHATTAGSQTSVALSALFSGRYFSQLEWRAHGVGAMRFLYPAGDPTPRFPELLAASGVRTASFCSLNFLAGEYGVLRGFSEESVFPSAREHALAGQVIGPLLDRLRRAGPEPLFIYAHLMEPHAPYDRGTKKGSNRDRYQSEIGVAASEIHRVMRLLAQRFPDRAVLIVTSDHGEAFGEHGTYYHTKTIYEEVLHVPLFIQGAGIKAVRVERHVGLIDLGPTILDLFGVPTPGGFMGQSLVPLLAGRDVKLDRPILAEGRLRRALYLQNGLKIIEDGRRKTVEAYDLAGDPGETRNLFDTEPQRVAPGLAALRRFFNVHEFSRPGYETPYKP